MAALDSLIEESVGQYRNDSVVYTWIPGSVLIFLQKL